MVEWCRVLGDEWSRGGKGKGKPRVLERLGSTRVWVQRLRLLLRVGMYLPNRLAGSF